MLHGQTTSRGCLPIFVPRVYSEYICEVLPPVGFCQKLPSASAKCMKNHLVVSGIHGERLSAPSDLAVRNSATTSRPLEGCTSRLALTTRTSRIHRNHGRKQIAGFCIKRNKGITSNSESHFKASRQQVGVNARTVRNHNSSFELFQRLNRVQS